MWLAAATLAAPTAAHHILGIPHYKYSEEYPQIPFVEVQARTPYSDVHFTYLPGTPRPGQDVRFKLYAKRRADGTPRTPKMMVEVVKHTFLGGTEPVLAPFEIEAGDGPESNDFKFFLRFEEAEAYAVRVHYPDESGEIERIDFPVTIGATDDRPLFAGAFGVVALAVATVFVVKRKRRPSGKKRAKEA